MKTIPLLLTALFSLWLALPTISADASHANVIRDSSGAIVERWQWVRLPDGSWRVTVRDASGRILRVFILRHLDGMERP